MGTDNSPASPSPNQLGLFTRAGSRPPETTHKTSRLSALGPTPVLESYWRLAFERQEILFRRLTGRPAPWTDDPILQRHRFTNAYRAVDRVSQYLIREVIYGSPSASAAETFFRVLLFKIFNKIETWELLGEAIGTISYSSFSVRRYSAILSRALEDGQAIYSAAYIMPPVRSFGRTRKHVGHLRLLRHMTRERLPERLVETRSMEASYRLLRAYPSMGPFLAYQYVIDLNYSPLLNFSEMDFVVAGPGARRGIQLCFENLEETSPEDVIRLVTEAQEDEFSRMGLRFQDLWGRPLQLIDCQNLFCEVDKYARVAHPETAEVTGRKRIKQRYRINPRPLRVWFPPKWGLNERLGSYFGARTS